MAAAAVLPAAPSSGQSLGLVLEFTAPGRPTAVTHAGDGTGRLFVALQYGDIAVFDGVSVLPEPFLRVPTSVGGFEQGLLGLAFHPAYATNGLFFVYYTGGGGDTVVSRFRVSTDDANRADPDSEQVLLRVPHPQPQHRAGQLAFGPDGFLYVAVGDGGDRTRAQDLGSLAGKILRIDVDTTDGSPYRIPPTNPFVSDPSARHEIWALGLRNPWRFSFDRGGGTLFVADVGESSYEEVNEVAPTAAAGLNFGWPLMEGPSCFEPPTDCNDGSLTLPTFGYDHTFGGAVIGGYVYRGSNFPELEGHYIFADLDSRILVVTEESSPSLATNQILWPQIISISTLGEDESGELYLAELDTGDVYRIVSTEGPGISIDDPDPVLESAAELVFSVRLTETHDAAVSVRYRVDGAASMVELQEGRLEIPPGEVTGLVRLVLVDDAIDEPDQTVRVVLDEPIRGQIFDPEGVTQVGDDDLPPFVSVGDCASIEGDAVTRCHFDVTLSDPSGWQTSVRYQAQPGTASAGADFDPTARTLSLAPGETSVSLGLIINGELLVEPDETYQLHLSTDLPNSRLRLGDGVGDGLILNDDFPPPSEPPVLLSPLGVIDQAQPTLRWGALVGASRYRATLVGPGQQLLWSQELPSDGACSSLECEAPLPISLPEWDYAWSVSAGNKVGFAPPSAPAVFTTRFPAHAITPAVGSADFSIDDGGVLGILFTVFPWGLEVDQQGDLLFGSSRRIWRYDPATRYVHAVAGDGTIACPPDEVPSATGSIANPGIIALDAAGNLYLAGSGLGSSCAQVWRIDAETGIMTSVAGEPGPFGFGGDGGPATEARLGGPPYGLAFDPSGNLLISDTFNHRVRRVDSATGEISTIAGTGSAGQEGDGGPAIDARLSSPRGLAVDDDGIFVATADSIRYIAAATGLISTVVGGDQSAIPAPLIWPWDVDLDPAGDLWIADATDNRVYRVDLRRRVAEAAAGTGLSTGPLGDGGPPLQARLSMPRAVAIDGQGTLYVTSTGDGRIRAIGNRAPIAVAGPDQPGASTLVVLDGGQSSDPDGDPLEYEWRGSDGELLGATSVVTTVLGSGQHVITLAVRDGHGGFASDEVRIDVTPVFRLWVADP